MVKSDHEITFVSHQIDTLLSAGSRRFSGKKSLIHRRPSLLLSNRVAKPVGFLWLMELHLRE